MTFFPHYLVCIYTLARLPLSHAAPDHTSANIHMRSAALEKLEVAERRSGALRLTLTTDGSAGGGGRSSNSSSGSRSRHSHSDSDSDSSTNIPCYPSTSLRKLQPLRIDTDARSSRVEVCRPFRNANHAAVAVVVAIVFLVVVVVVVTIVFAIVTVSYTHLTLTTKRIV